MVYLVDDDRDDVEIVQEALVRNSYKGPVRAIENGRELMQQLEAVEAKPDVILLDLNMPLKDGFEALHEIKTHPELTNIPVIIVTASSKKDDERRCMQMGCNYYYTKPTTMDGYNLLVSMVKFFIEQQRRLA